MRQVVTLGLLACALACAAVAAVSLGPGGGVELSRAPFLSSALGAPTPSGSLKRQPAPGVSVTIERQGYRVARGGRSVSLTARPGYGDGTGAWQRFTHGAERRTSFGREAITIERRKTEQFLTVAERQGARTWRWTLGAGKLRPQLMPDGGVEFLLPGPAERHDHGGHVHFHTQSLRSDFRLLPVEILDAQGRNITPDGLRWSLRGAGSSRTLELRLDDSRLPLPYVIDPAIVLRSFTQTGADVGTTFTLAKPAGVLPNDFLIAVVSVRGGTGTSITPPSGWTLIRRDDRTTELGQALYYKVAGAGEPASYSWTLGPAARAAGGIHAYTGVDNSNPFDAGDLVNTGTGTSVVAPSITTTTNNALVVMFFGLPNCSNGGSFWAAGAGLTERLDVNSPGSPFSTRVNSGSGDFTQATAGATGTRTMTGDSSGNWIAQTVALRLDNTPPVAPAPTISESSPNSHASGSTFYYRPAGAGGTFTVDIAASDGQSGVNKVNFPALGGGFTPATALDVLYPGPYSRTYTWPATTGTESGAKTLTVTDNAAGINTNTFTITADSTPPSSHSASIAGGYYATPSVAVTLNNGSDSGAGVNPASGIVERDEVALAADSCGAFPGSWSTVTLSGGNDTSVVSGRCYRYRYKISDNVGNQSTQAGTSATGKVDTSAPTPAPGLSYGSFSNAALAGGVVYYRPDAASGQFHVTAAGSSDPESGVSGYTFPAAAGGWSRSVVGATATYSHSGSPTDPVEPNDVTAQNNAGLSSSGTSFTVTPDASMPSTSIQCDGAACSAGWYPSSPVSVTLSGNDSDSGVSQIKYTTDGSDPTLGNGTVYAGAFDLATTTTVKYRAWDNVGNSEAVQTKLVQIDVTAPSVPTFSFSAPTNAAASGQTVYFRTGAAGGFTVTASSSDGESGIASYAFPALGSGWSGSQAGASYDFSFTNAAADPVEPNNTTATNNAGLTSSPGSFTVTADGLAPVTSILCDGASCAAGWYTSSVSVSLSSSDGASGIQEIRYTTDGSDPSPINGIVYAAPFSVASPTTVKFRAYDRVGNEEAVGSQLVLVDSSAPTAPVLTLSESPGSANQHVSGTTLFYSPSGSNSGSFTVDAATSDPQSGIEKVTFPAVTGMTGGGDDATSPYQGTYDWTSSTSGSGPQTVTAHNAAGFTANSSFSVTPDSTAPTGQTAALVGGPYYTSASVGFTIGDGSDSGSGLDTSSRLVERALAPLTNGSCGGFGGFGGSYSSPDASVQSGTCYRYRFTIADNVGNVSTAVVTADAKVDTSAPTATMTDPGANLRGTVTLTSTTDDPESGVATITYERSPAGLNSWTATPASWDTTLVADGLYDLRVNATNNAGVSTSSAPITNRRVDNTPPSATMNDPGANLSGTVSLTSTTSDGGSGIAGIAYEYSQAGLNSWTATPASWDTTLVADGLYDLRVTAVDQAGNSTTSAPVVNRRVDNVAPTVSITSPTAFVNGSDPDPFTVAAGSPDTDLSGVEFFACDNVSASCATGSWVSLGTDGSAPFTIAWNLPGADGNRALRAVVTDLSFNTGQAVVNVTIDRFAPSGGSVSYLDGYDTTGSLTITTADGTDSGTGIDPASRVLQRDSVSLAAGTCDAFTGSWTTVTSPDSVASGNCYRYRYRLADFAGNLATYTSGNVAKVDTSAPSAPTFSFSALTNAVASGQTVFFRPGLAGGFTASASANDAESGVAAYAFPALGPGWSGSQSGASYDYSFNSSAGDPAEPNNVSAQNNAGLSTSTSFTVSTDGAAPVSSIACDGASCAGQWYTSSVSVSLAANDGAGSGLDEIRYTTDGSDPSPINGTVYSAPFSLGATTTVKFRSYDVLGNEEAVASQLVSIDDTAPSAPALALSESPASPKQHVSGTTLFYNPQGGNSGTFTVDATTSDAQSGIDKVSFPALSGMTGGGDDSSSPYQSSYSWMASSSASGSQSVDAVNNAGLSASSSFTVTPDTAPPSTGSVSYPGGYASGSVTITTDDGSDALSGVNPATGVIERDETNLVEGTCDPFTGAWSAVTSPDSTITVGHCYKYRYRVSDNVGNEAIYTSGNVVKVAAGAPSAPDLTLAETPGSPNQYVSGTTIFYGATGGNSGTFTVTASVTDSGGSGVDKVGFPSLTGMTGGGDDSTSPYQGVYDWDATSSASGAQTVTVYNNAGLTSQASFTVTPDTAPPTGQDASVAGGYYTSLSVPVTLQNGSDALSGVDPASGIVERETGTLSNGNCVAWSGSWSTVTLSGGADTTVATNSCYRYHYIISDRVGNQAAPSATSLVAKVDATTPITIDDAPAGWQNVPVTVTLSVNETGSGVASTVYRVDGGSFQGGTSIFIPAPADHSNDGAHTVEYRTTDNAGNVESLRSATVRIDTTLPTTTDDAPGGWQASAVTVTLSPADALSGIASTQYRVDGGAFQGGTSVAIPAPADHSNDGVHTIEYGSTDNAANVEPLQTATVSIDTTLPAGALTAPADGAHMNGPVAVTAAASDLPSGVASVEFLVRPNGAGAFTSISTDTTAPYDASWDSTSAPEGNAELKVVVLDNAGLSVTSAIRTVLVDNPPVPTLDDPGANVSGTVTLTASSQPDTTQVVFERSPVGAGTWTQIATDATAPFSTDLDTSGLPEGSYDLRVVATDGGGFNGTSSLRTSRVDNTAPTVNVSDPVSGAVVGGSNVHLAALATDSGSGVSSVRFEQRPASGGAFTLIGTDATDPYEASWDTTGLSGDFELRAVATDAAGNPATAATVTVTVDSAAASVTLSDPGTLLRGVVDLSASAPSAAVTSVAFERRPVGGSWTTITVDATLPWGATLDTKSFGDGVYELRAQALGNAGQVLATHSREGIRVDNTAPAMLSATPADGSVVSPVTSITVVASEPVAAAPGATLDASAATAQISGSNVTFSTSSLGAGPHVLTGSLVDAAGNSGAFSVHFTIKVKAHTRLIVRVSKAETKSRGKNRVFRVRLSLSTPARVTATLLSPSGRRLRTLRTQLSPGGHSLRFVLPAASLPPGRYTILIVATGSDGSKVKKRVYVTVQRAKTTGKKPAETPTRPKAVVIPVASTPGPGGGSDSPTPPAQTSKPTPKKQAPPPSAKPGPLETASGYVSEKSNRTVGLVALLLVLGTAIAFLIKLEMTRMFASPRR